MLPLESLKWHELSHAYGKAIDTPDLLQQLYDVSATEEIPDDLLAAILIDSSIETGVLSCKMLT